MRILNADGPVYKFLYNLVALVELNFLWLLCSLPIVTLGGATIAAFDVAMKLIGEQEGHVARDFFRSFKRNFKNGIPYGILLLFCAYVVWLDFSLFDQIQGNPMILLVMGIVAAFVFVLCFLFAFPLQARYDNTLIRTLKNSADIAMKYFVRTLTLLIALAAQIFLFFWNSFTLTIGFFIGPACVIYTIGAYARHFFAEIEKEPGSVTCPEQ